MSEPKVSYSLEETKVKLPKGSETSIVYALPSRQREPSTCLILAHGAGGPMHSPFIRFFHTELAKQGYIAVKFNFPYMEARRKVPDRTDVLEGSYRLTIEHARNHAPKTSRMFVGGKSMGGRIASQTVAANNLEVDGLFFLGYPLHPPGRTEQLRDKHLYTIKKPMLFLSGTRDSFARKDLLESVVERIGSNARLHWIEGGDHSFKTPGTGSVDPDGKKEALDTLLEWLVQIS